MVLRRHKFDHISSGIRDELHWLPVAQCINFKMCLLSYKCLHNMAPLYLANLCVPVDTNVGRSRIRSTTRGDLKVPSTRTSYGARSFAVAGPRLWNDLPVDVRDQSLSLAQFKTKLKTHLFKVAY